MLSVGTPLERTACVRHNGSLAPVVTAMALLACYGDTAAKRALSPIGISVALPFRAPVIVLFPGIAATGLAGRYQRHHNRPAVALGLLGFILIAGRKVLLPSLKAGAIALERAGFIRMVGGNILALRARRQAGLSCAVRCAG